MFLDIWLKNIDLRIGWYVFLFTLFFLGIVIGFFFQRFRRFFNVVTIFLFFLIGCRLLLHDINPLQWSRDPLNHLFFKPKSIIFWLAIIISLVISGIVLSSKKGEYGGNFFSGFIVAINLYYCVIWLSDWVDLIRFIKLFSFQSIILISFILGILSVSWKGLLRALSSLLGSSLLVIAFCDVLKRLGASDTFLGQSPFVLFVFLVVAVLMDAVQSRS